MKYEKIYQASENAHSNSLKIEIVGKAKLGSMELDKSLRKMKQVYKAIKAIR